MTPDLHFKIDLEKFPTTSLSHQIPDHLSKLALPSCRTATAQHCPAGYIIRQDLHKPEDHQIFTIDFILYQKMEPLIEISAPLVLMLMTLNGEFSLKIPVKGWQTIEKNYYNLYHLPTGVVNASCDEGDTRIFCLSMSPEVYNIQTSGMDNFIRHMRQAMNN